MLLTKFQISKCLLLFSRNKDERTKLVFDGAIAGDTCCHPVVVAVVDTQTGLVGHGAECVVEALGETGNLWDKY